MSNLDCQAISYGWTDWIPDSCAGSDAVTALTGSDAQEQTWNFFKSKGLSDVQVAAIIGNLMQESSINPERIQDGYGNGKTTSENPLDAGAGGYGIAQWTPASTLIDDAANLNITTPIYQLATQLNVVWGQMQTTTPVGVSNLVQSFKQLTDLSQAVSAFVNGFEGPLTVGPRLQYAQQALAKYGNSQVTPTTSGSTTESSACGSSSGTSPQCAAATGNTRILCDAKLYDTVSYSETVAGGHQGGAAWHATCPVIGPSCILDCSGLVNIAVYDVFGADLQENTYGEINDIGKYWEYITFDQIQPGDLIQPNTDHVEIIDYVGSDGTTLYTFGAHTSQVAQPDQVGPATYPNAKNAGYVYLRYIGPGH